MEEKNKFQWRKKIFNNGSGIRHVTKRISNNVKINKSDFINLKYFHNSTDAIRRVRKQPTEWAKIFLNHISDTELISEYIF